MKWLIDRLVDSGILDRWRGKRASWIGRLVLRSDSRALGRAGRALKEWNDGKDDSHRSK